MKRMIVAVLVLVAGVVCAEPTNGLDVLVKSYAVAEAKLNVAISDAYRKVLADALADAKKKGDLDGYGLVDAERKRFEAEKSVPATNALPNAYAGRVPGMLNEGLVRKVDLLKKYVVALDVLLKKEMGADRMDAAKAVKDERSRVEFLLADAEMKLPKVEEKPKEDEAKDGVKTVWVDGSWQYVVDGVTWYRDFNKGRCRVRKARKVYWEGTYEVASPTSVVTTGGGGKETHTLLGDGRMGFGPNVAKRVSVAVKW